MFRPRFRLTWLQVVSGYLQYSFLFKLDVFLIKLDKNSDYLCYIQIKKLLIFTKSLHAIYLDIKPLILFVR